MIRVKIMAKIKVRIAPWVRLRRRRLGLGDPNLNQTAALVMPLNIRLSPAISSSADCGRMPSCTITSRRYTHAYLFRSIDGVRDGVRVGAMVLNVSCIVLGPWYSIPMHCFLPASSGKHDNETVLKALPYESNPHAML